MTTKKKLTEGLFRETHKWLIPTPLEAGATDSKSARYVATMERNLEGLGFCMDTELAETISAFPEDVAIDILQDIFTACKKEIGADRLIDARIMYPGFPEQVIESDDFDLLVQQLTYYFGEYYLGVEILPEQEHVDRDALMEGFPRDLKSVHAGSQEDINRLAEDRILSRISLSEYRMEYIKDFLEEYGLVETMKLYDGKTIPNKENASLLAKTIYDQSMDRYGKIVGAAEQAMKAALPGATDVLRLAALLSNGKTITGKEKYKTMVWHEKDRSDRHEEWRTRRVKTVIENDATLSDKTKFKLNHIQERVIKDLLSESKSLYEDIWAHPDLFRNLGHQVSMRNSTPERLTRAYDNLAQNARENEKGSPIRTPNAFLARAAEEVAKGDCRTAGFIAKNFPGVFSRGFVHLLNSADSVKTAEKICDMYEEHCTDVPLQSQLKLFNVLRTIPDRTERVIYESKINRYVRAAQPPFRHPGVLPDAVTAVLHSMENQLEPGASLGKVCIDPALSGISVPGNGERSASKGAICPRGSLLNGNPDCNIVRMFAWWTNAGKESVDIDTAAVFLNKDLNPVAHCAYYSQKAVAGFLDDEWGDPGDKGDLLAIHSGDLVNGGPVNGDGVAEFLDIDKEACRAAGVKYVVLSVHAYTNENFCDLPNLKWGYMQREGSLDLGIKEHDAFRFNGQVFEPSTVECCVDINTHARQTIPAVYDVENETFLWMDEPIRGIDNDLTNAANPGFQEQLRLMMDYDSQGIRGSLAQLFSLHAMSRGEITEDIAEADTVFLLKDADPAALPVKEGAEVVTLRDFSRITSEFLAPPKPGSDSTEDPEREKEHLPEYPSEEEAASMEKADNEESCDVPETPFQSALGHAHFAEEEYGHIIGDDDFDR